MQKVLVTGGAGFIGSHTVERLLATGTPVRVLDNLASGQRSNLPDHHEQLEFIEGDITEAPVVDRAMAGVSHCLHLAAQVSVVASLEDPEQSARQNIVGFVNVLHAAREHGIRRLIYASSAAVYGKPEVIPLAEDAAALPISPYGLEKQVNEAYADLYRRLYGTSTFGLRYFNVFGPRQDLASPYSGVIALFTDRIARGKPLVVYGDGKQTRDFIYVGDVAMANIAALQGLIDGVCNVGTGQQITLLKLIDILSDLSGQSCQVDFAPPRDGDIRHSCAVVDKMRSELGVSAETTIESGLATLLEECRATG